MFKRIFLIVLDSVGIGQAPDATDYDDVGAHTLGHIAENFKLNIPNLERLGLGLIEDLKGVKKVAKPLAYVTKIAEKSLGKDTMTGHWEMMGLYITEPFKTFTDTGFDAEIILELEKQTGRKVVGNKSASGTDIILEYGLHHEKTGDLIVYTSADSVLQIAAHEDIIPIDEQYRICQIARDIMMEPKWKVGRIIARPFIGTYPHYTRTPNRHDYALKPFDKTVLNHLEEKGFDTIALGKINDIFDGYGITKYEKTKSNDDGMDKITNYVKHDFTGLCFLNLVDFDALYGHRRDVEGYGNAINQFDTQLPQLIEGLKDDDLLILTADHGNDPTFKGTDHTREYVPLIVYSKQFKDPKKLEVLHNFADIAQTIADNFKTESTKNGTSFLNKLK